MKRRYEVHQGGQVSSVVFDAEERRKFFRDKHEEERTANAEAIRHAIATLERPDWSPHRAAQSKELLRGALHRITGTRE